MNAIAHTQLVTYQAERIFALADDAGQAETYASIEAVALEETHLGSVYTFADRSTLTVKGMAMRWDGAKLIETALSSI